MNYSQYAVILSENKKVIVGGENVNNAESATTETGTAEPSTAASGGGFFGENGMMWIVIIYVVLFGGMYFFISRPQKKKEKELKELQSALGVGDDVVTSGGFYGKIVDTADNTFIVEFGTNKGIRIPVNKAEVFPAKNKPSDNKEDKTDK